MSYVYDDNDDDLRAAHREIFRLRNVVRNLEGAINEIADLISEKANDDTKAIKTVLEERGLL